MMSPAVAPFAKTTELARLAPSRVVPPTEVVFSKVLAVIAPEPVSVMVPPDLSVTVSLVTVLSIAIFPAVPLVSTVKLAAPVVELAAFIVTLWSAVILTLPVEKLLFALAVIADVSALL